MSINTCKQLVSLISSVMEGSAPFWDESMDISALVALAKKHSVENLLAYALLVADISLTDEQRQQLSRYRDKALMQDIHQQMDYEQLSKAFSQNKIRFIPLKGALLKALYPQTDYRTMSDIDIFVDESEAEKIHDIMLSLGYEAERIGYDIHDEYHKKPATRVEVHRELFCAGGAEYSALFTDIWSRCSQASEYCYELYPEEFFKYLLAHGMKHYVLGGTGIRTFLDISIYLRHHGDDIDINRVFSAFEEVGQRQLCQDMIKLSQVWFDGAEPDERTLRMAEYVISGGAYGTLDNQVKYEVQNKGKAGYVVSKLFPNLKTMREQYPALRKAPALLPAFWLIRIVTKPFINRRQNMKKLRSMAKYK